MGRGSGGGGRGKSGGGGGGSASAPAPPQSPAALESRIAAVYRDVASPGGRARIADIHAALPDVPLRDLHAGLSRLAESGKASLLGLDNPREIGPRDRAAVFRTPSGAERHIIYLGGRRG